MKITITTLLASLCSTICLADVTIEQKVKAPTGDSVVQMRIKGDKIRTDVGDQVTTIMDATTGDAVTLMHANKMAMKVSGEQIKKMQEAMMQNNNGQPPKPVNTGKKEKVGDYDCEVWAIEMMGVKSTFWVAKDYPKYEEIKKDMDAMSKTLGQGMATTDFGGMVVKVKAEANGQITESEVQSVKTDSIDEKIFVLPDGYNTINAPGQN